MTLQHDNAIRFERSDSARKLRLSATVGHATAAGALESHRLDDTPDCLAVSHAKIVGDGATIGFDLGREKGRLPDTRRAAHQRRHATPGKGRGVHWHAPTCARPPKSWVLE